MELDIAFTRKYSSIILAELKSLGFHCQEPISLMMHDVSPNGRVAAHGDYDRDDDDTTQLLSMFDRVCSEPWFDKKTMYLHLSGREGTCSTIPALRHDASQLFARSSQ